PSAWLPATLPGSASQVALKAMEGGSRNHCSPRWVLARRRLALARVGLVCECDLGRLGVISRILRPKSARRAGVSLRGPPDRLGAVRLPSRGVAWAGWDECRLPGA